MTENSCRIVDGAIERPTGPLALAKAYAHHGLAERIHIPETSIFSNLEISAQRFPDKTAIQFYNASIAYIDLLRDVERMAGYLQHVCGVKRGDRVIVFSQNCPQFIVAYFAILRADAVFIPVNAMLLRDELAHILVDSGATVAFVASELAPQIEPLLDMTPLRYVIVHAYGDALGEDAHGLAMPDWLRARSAATAPFAGAELWNAALAQGHAPTPHQAGSDDLCMLPYTSGTTGAPKACAHTHRSVMTACVGSTVWRRLGQEATSLCVAPLFHLLGLQTNLNSLFYVGGTIVLMARWDREIAATLMERHRVTFWAAPPTMLVDFFAQPGIEQRDFSSLALVSGGGAATPQSINDILRDRYGLDYLEGYGLTETASFLISNPFYKLKKGCLGVPTFGVDARLIDPDTLQEVSAGEVGEIVVHGAQVMRGYWNNDKANSEAFVAIDGKRFFRTGDLASVDFDGYFFIRDRLKRMINASGYKVWPAEVEAILHDHPSILEACVISAPDAHRGETVKAIVALKHDATDGAADILAWCREHMANYKAPRYVEIVDSLPKSATGKIAWRELQDREALARAPGATS
jgi:long-chain acyl-CoA synthetase